MPAIMFNASQALNISQICYCSIISLHSDALNCSFSGNLNFVAIKWCKHFKKAKREVTQDEGTVKKHLKKYELRRRCANLPWSMCAKKCFLAAKGSRVLSQQSHKFAKLLYIYWQKVSYDRIQDVRSRKKNTSSSYEKKIWGRKKQIQSCIYI